MERYDIKAVKSVLDDLLRIISSAVGSLSNPKKISDTFRSELGISTNSVTVDRYLDYFIDAFLLRKVQRYDVKGRKYIGTPMKYYFADLGIRNALLEFRQQEENHIMENIIYNELIVRGFSVDVGMVEYRHRNEEGKDVKLTNSNYTKFMSSKNEEVRKSAFNNLYKSTLYKDYLQDFEYQINDLTINIIGESK